MLILQFPRSLANSVATAGRLRRRRCTPWRARHRQKAAAVSGQGFLSRSCAVLLQPQQQQQQQQYVVAATDKSMNMYVSMTSYVITVGE